MEIGTERWAPDRAAEQKRLMILSKSPALSPIPDKDTDNEFVAEFDASSRYVNSLPTTAPWLSAPLEPRRGCRTRSRAALSPDSALHSLKPFDRHTPHPTEPDTA